MLRRVLILSFVLVHLAYGTAAMADAHWVWGGEHELAQPVGAADDGDAHLACDHCCHAASHLAALPGSHPSGISGAVAARIAPAVPIFESIPATPLPKPPRA